MDSGHLLMWVLVFLIVFAGSMGSRQTSQSSVTPPAPAPAQSKSIKREVFLILVLLALWQLGSMRA